MELAMHCRDSGRLAVVRVLYGSEWTVGARHSGWAVAFPGSVRQQLLVPSHKPRKKVACFGGCYSLWCASSGPAEESQHMLFWAGLSFPAGLSTITDCVQCV